MVWHTTLNALSPQPSAQHFSPYSLPNDHPPHEGNSPGPIEEAESVVFKTTDCSILDNTRLDTGYTVTHAEQEG